ncbi:histidine kinase [Bacteroides sp. 224]|uniref:tetratricopeptide repeat-containing sensor histidine kinase n=1 Tax=Bacteroides sp. 224 TaxID=2302936 RepID=UPI0013D3BBAD|nr:histidine kinase [Bacteroides sp. 224]NDV64785.1 sensor histidine kinase [Bacteroides sp. 224]
MLLKKLLIIAFLFPSVIVCGQDSLYQYSRQNSTSKAASKLKKSLETSKSAGEIAADYMVLANELSLKQEYAKAENYLSQAISSYQKGKDKEALANAYREIARVQELQSKSDLAIENYNLAAKTTKKKEFEEMNLNDASRLKNRLNPEIQSTYIQRNIDISNLSNNQKEAANAYRQMAEVKLEMKDKEGAIDNLVSALDNVSEQSEEAVKIKQDIAQTYLEDEQYEKAIAINEALVEETKKISNPELEVKQLRNLSTNYLEVNNSEKAISALQEAYELAIHSGQTMEAKKTLEELVSQYRKSKNNTQALLAYANFIEKLDTLIKSDSTLIDQKFFQEHEDKIAQLEKERVLKDELISKKNRFNYVLLGSITLILIFTIFIARSLYTISHKNKKIALQSLRREMNPHFIFNSLNSVNQFIAQSNELEANKYLSSYSRLMRNVMENSNKDFISLSTEIEQMKEYLELEHIRFRDKFTYQIIIDESLDADAVYIPNMVIQPQLENAIWHGLRYKEEAGFLLLDIQQKGNNLHIRIEDNGIGLKKSKELKTQHQKQHHSRGLINTYERIELLNKLYHTHISLRIEEKEGAESGVVVTLEFPISNLF